MADEAGMIAKTGPNQLHLLHYQIVQYQVHVRDDRTKSHLFSYMYILQARS